MSWYSVKDAAPLIGLCQETTYNLCKSGRLAHRRLGLNKGRGRIQISDEAIKRFLEGCEIAEEPAPAPQGRAGRAKSKPTPGYTFKYL